MKTHLCWRGLWRVLLFLTIYAAKTEARAIEKIAKGHNNE